MISVRSLVVEEDLPAGEYYTSQVLQDALEKIYDFYGKYLDGQTTSIANLIQEEVHVYSRANLRPVLLVGILKTTVESSLRQQAAEEEHPGALTADYQTPTFLKKIRS